MSFGQIHDGSSDTFFSLDHPLCLKWNIDWSISCIKQGKNSFIIQTYVGHGTIKNKIPY